MSSIVFPDLNNPCDNCSTKPCQTKCAAYNEFTTKSRLIGEIEELNREPDSLKDAHVMAALCSIPDAGPGAQIVVLVKVETPVNVYISGSDPEPLTTLEVEAKKLARQSLSISPQKSYCSVLSINRYLDINQLTKKRKIK